MKDVFIEIEFINIDNKIIKKKDVIINEIYLKIIEEYIKYIDGKIIK